MSVELRRQAIKAAVRNVRKVGTGLDYTGPSRARALQFYALSLSGLAKYSLEPVGLLQFSIKISDFFNS